MVEYIVILNMQLVCSTFYVCDKYGEAQQFKTNLHLHLLAVCNRRMQWSAEFYIACADSLRVYSSLQA